MSAKREKLDAPNGAFADETSALPAIADLLEYPGVDWDSVVVATLELLADANSELAMTFAKFHEGIENLSLSEHQELYTRTFDLNPVCALEIGYHLFGENYKRGQFLASLRETETPFELGQEHQLPDYLPVLLRLLIKLDDEELRASLVGECLIPAIGKMIASFKDSENPYRHLLAAVRATLQAEPGVDSSEASNRTFARASLPVLTNDPRNYTNTHEFTQKREFPLPDFRAASCDFVEGSQVTRSDTDSELF